MDNIKFTFSEVASLIGIIQCVFVIVHVFFRAGDFKQVILPVLFFLTLSVAFLSDFGRGYVLGITPYYDVINWAAWTSIIPLSVLLIFQMAHIRRLPSLFWWSILLLVPIILMANFTVVPNLYDECRLKNVVCTPIMEWLNVSYIVAGAMALLVIWSRRNLFADVQQQPAGKERYWLILSLIILNVVLLILTTFTTVGYEGNSNFIMMRGVLGLGFVYLVSTSMFRMYPSALFTEAKKHQPKEELDKDDESLVVAVENLIKVEKIYHEASYSRSDLARELNVTEASVSRIINLHYKKSFPQVLNEYRIEDAKRLLLDTDASIAVVAQEVGFNSISSFNRVFKDIEGRSPSSYRRNMIK